MVHRKRAKLTLLLALLVLFNFIEIAFAEDGMDIHDVHLTILFDNTDPAAAGLVAEWGFACLVEAGGHRLLFDTGGSSAILKNMRKLGIDPADLEAVVLSHAHGDHYGGFPTLVDEFSPDTPIYLPSSLAGKLPGVLEKWGGDTRVVTDQIDLFPGIRLTQALPAREPERALVLEGKEGCIVITGCAHPGLPRILDEVSLMTGGKRPLLLMGGFHLKSSDRLEVDHVINEIVGQDVKYVLPTHCTGEKAVKRFREVFGQRCLIGGAGRVIVGADLYQ